ncbi:MAG: DUF4351 domain-containing protein [Gammaproteobacteria bacterium]|nr:DUF4351 domain-containing protein [Gammaproteobacteria bacterium]
MAYITGIEQLGLERGMRQGEAAVLSRQLQRKFGDKFTDVYRQRVDEADVDTLLDWSEQVLRACLKNPQSTAATPELWPAALRKSGKSRHVARYTPRFFTFRALRDPNRATASRRPGIFRHALKRKT